MHSDCKSTPHTLGSQVCFECETYRSHFSEIVTPQTSFSSHGELQIQDLWCIRIKRRNNLADLAIYTPTRARSLPCGKKTLSPCLPCCLCKVAVPVSSFSSFVLVVLYSRLWALWGNIGDNLSLLTFSLGRQSTCKYRNHHTDMVFNSFLLVCFSDDSWVVIAV